MKIQKIGLIFLLVAISTIFQGCSKSDFLVSPVSNITPCPNAKLSVTLIRGTTYMGTMDLPYSGVKPSANTIVSSGVKGLSATFKTDKSTSDNGYLHYTISGSPDTTGNAVFLVNFNDNVCKVVLPIKELTGLPYAILQAK